MKTGRRTLRILGILGLATLSLVLAGCKTGDRTTGQALSDKMTAHRVKSALNDAPIFKYPDVAVNVYDGNVQLTGFVATQEQREDAAQIAARVKGVNQVVNNIMIHPTPTGPAAIRDPLGKDKGYMLDTNAPPHKPLNMQPAPTPTEKNEPNTQSNPNPNQ